MRRWPVVFLALALVAVCGCGEERPPSEDADASVPWGAVANGLQLSVQAPQTVYAEGEPMVFQVRVRNVGETELRLAHFEDDMWWYRLRFENLDDGPDFDAANEELIDFSSPPDGMLDAGEVWEKELKLTKWGRFLRVIPDRKPGDDWDYRKQLPVGRFRARLVWDGDPDSRDGFWQGRLESNILEIEVVEAP